jgi:hypothetical protein
MLFPPRAGGLARTLAMKYFPDAPAQSPFARSIVFGLPLLYLAVALGFSAHSAPWGQRVDPESAYAMNGIVAALGYGFMKNDHPGTSTILLVDIIVRVWTFLTGRTDTVEFSLKNYDAIIYAARAAEALIMTAALAAGGSMVRTATRSAIAAVLFQVSPFLSVEAMQLEADLTPESLMVSSAILAMAIAVKAALGDRPPTPALAVLSGLNFALGLSSKYLYLALAPLGLCFVRNPRAMAAALVTSILAFVLFNRIFNPLVFSSGFHWLVSLATHKGTYGQGEPGFIDIHQFWANMADLLRVAPLVNALFGLAALTALARMIKSGRYLDPVSLTLLGAFLAFVIQLVATSKHFAVHYMFASWVLSGGVLVLTIVELRRLLPALPSTLLAGAGALVCGYLMVTTLAELRQATVELVALNDTGARLSSAVAAAGPVCADVSGMFVQAPENAINHGADMAFGTPEIENRFSEAYGRLFKAPLLDHKINRNLLYRNFLPYDYTRLAADYPCIVVRSFRLLDGPPELLRLNPEHCPVGGVEVYTVGIACSRIERAFAEQARRG